MGALQGIGWRDERCEDRVLDRPASGNKGSKGRNELDCIRGKGGGLSGAYRVLVDATLLVGAETFRLSDAIANPSGAHVQQRAHWWWWDAFTF